MRRLNTFPNHSQQKQQHNAQQLNSVECCTNSESRNPLDSATKTGDEGLYISLNEKLRLSRAIWYLPTLNRKSIKKLLKNKELGVSIDILSLSS
jgi:hypothetical protein